MIKYFKYVPNGFVYLWQEKGWISHPSLDDSHHGIYCTLMEWTGEGEPVCPEEKTRADKPPEFDIKIVA